MLASLAALLITAPAAQSSVLVYEAPAGREFAQVVPGGRTILPNGRLLTPKGERLYTKENLWGVLGLSQGRTLALHDGGFTLFPTTGGVMAARKLERKENAFCAVLAKKRKEIIVSTGDSGGLEILDAETLESKGEVSAKTKVHQHPYVNDIVVSKDERFAYAVDIAHQTLLTFDLASRKLIETVPAGREPYALALSEDGESLFLANIGLFNYSLIPKGPDGKTRLTKPPFGFPSRESERGVEVEGRFIPGIGSPYVADAQSIWAYDLSNPGMPKVAKKIKAGLMIHAPADGGKAVGGSAPNDLLVHQGRLFVSCANNDRVEVYDVKTLKRLASIKLTPVAGLSRYRGVIPSGMAVEPSGRRLFVSESGLNSVVALDTKSLKVIGRIPTGWFPTGLDFSSDGKRLLIATQKGIGRGPRGEFHQRQPGDERFGLPDMPGMVDSRTLPTDSELAKGIQEVIANNGLAPVRRPAGPKVFPRVPGRPSPHIKHVVFITKENHTFDGIFGELKSRGAKADPRYAEWGRQGWLREKSRTEKVPIMTNHLALADQFAISDNFYMEPQASGDGHRWLVGVYPSLWTTRVFYSGWDYRPIANAQGRFVSFGSYGTQFPEDYLENGSIWEHLDRGGLTFRNYGEGYEMPRGYQERTNNRAGVEPVMNHPMPAVLFKNTDFDFPAYNTWIPDVFRADWFKEDMEEYRQKHKGKIPQFINIAICNDHGDSVRAEQGYPHVASYMADNDLALGRIVEYLSHLPEWKNMAIFVTQDDPGGDNDSVDRHRSFVLGISPYIKRGYISRDHTSIMSIIKSIYLLHGLGPNNMFDAVATDLHDMFTDKPDFRPFKHVPVDPRVFVEEKTIDPTDPKFERRRRESNQVRMDDPDFMEWLRKGGTGQYPGSKK